MAAREQAAIGYGGTGLERNIIAFRVGVGHTITTLVAATAAAFAALGLASTGEEAHGVGSHFKGGARPALPLPNFGAAGFWIGAQRTFDQHLASLAQVLVTGFSLLAPGAH